jgi:arginyl-tRNA synthetase
MKEAIISLLSKHTKLSKEQIENLIEIPPSSELGDYAFPCFVLAKELKKNPVEIAKSLAGIIKSGELEKVEARGPYLNFFINRTLLAEATLKEILKQKSKYGCSNTGKGKTIVIDMSSPNIAKPFGIGHLRSTMIGNSIAEISKYLGYKAIKLNYLGDWGTPFGKIILGWKKFGNEQKFKQNPIKHLYELYVKVSQDASLEDDARKEFKLLEDGNKESIALWKKFREYSLKDFNKIYSILKVEFNVISGESEYNDQMDKTIEELKRKSLLLEDQGAELVDLETYGLGKCLIRKSDGATLYATRDITAAIDRVKKYKADYLFYEVGQEQKLHFKQFFKVLELMGYKWAKNCKHIDHGLYLDKDGKKFATREGKTIFMEDILDETISLAKSEIAKREKLSEKALLERAKSIARAAIIYGDLRNYRSQDVIFDISRFLEFEGNTGPYLLYSYARSKSILRNAKSKKKIGKSKKFNKTDISESEKALITELSKFPEVVQKSFENLSPNLIANYAFNISQKFNEFYHSNKVIGSDNEQFRLSLVNAFSIVLCNSLSLLAINTLEKM